MSGLGSGGPGSGKSGSGKPGSDEVAPGELAADTVIGRGTEHVETRVGEQVMMMSIAQGKYYALEASAQRIWDLIETPRTLGALVDELVAEYDVARETCAREVRAFVADLLANGLVVTDPGDGARA